jgi:hypothetical protein
MDAVGKSHNLVSVSLTVHDPSDTAQQCLAAGATAVEVEDGGVEKGKVVLVPWGGGRGGGKEYDEEGREGREDRRREDGGEEGTPKGGLILFLRLGEAHTGGQDSGWRRERTQTGGEVVRQDVRRKEGEGGEVQDGPRGVREATEAKGRDGGEGGAEGGGREGGGRDEGEGGAEGEGRGEKRPTVAAESPRSEEEEEGEEGSEFPTLNIELLRCSRPRNVRANTRHALPIETGTFQGAFLLLLRDDDTDPPEPRHHRHMFHRKQRRFCIQVQGRFKVGREGGREGGLGEKRHVLFHLLFRSADLAAVLHPPS